MTTDTEIKNRAKGQLGLLATIGLKSCTRCSGVNPIDQYFRDKTRHDKRSPWCKDCLKTSNDSWRRRNKFHVREVAKRWEKNNIEHVRELNRESKKRVKNRDPEKWKQRQRAQNLAACYGLSLAEFEAMRTQQNACCAICGIAEQKVKETRLHVDHCHDTNIVRALLCGNCNKMLGHAREDISILKSAIVYLEKYNDN